MKNDGANKLVAAFALPFVKGQLPLTSADDVCNAAAVMVRVIAEMVEGESTPQAKYNAAMAILSALMINPYALIEAGWDGYAEPRQDS